MSKKDNLHIIPDIIFHIGRDWETESRRYMIEAMARYLEPLGGKVLCVTRPVDLIVTPVKHTTRFLRWLDGAPSLTQVSSNLFVYCPFIPVYDLLALTVAPIRRINRMFLKYNINKILIRLRFQYEYLINWTFDPIQGGYLDLFGEILLVYEICDLLIIDLPFSRGGTSTWAKAWLQSMERLLLDQVDIVFTTSPTLAEPKKLYHSNVHYIPNGVDFENLSRASDSSTPIAEELRNLSHPIVGFLGSINERYDFDLLTFLAEQRSSWSFVCVGPVKHNRLKSNRAFTRFERLPNVVFLGWIAREKIPQYGKMFDVCVIPYRTNYEFNQYANPIKLYEYTAMGKPVVSTDVSEISCYKDIIYVAKNAQEVLEVLKKSISEDNPAKMHVRLKRAENDSWEKRVSEKLMLIQDTLDKKLSRSICSTHAHG